MAEKIKKLHHFFLKDAPSGRRVFSQQYFGIFRAPHWRPLAQAPQRRTDATVPPSIPVFDILVVQWMCLRITFYFCMMFQDFGHTADDKFGRS